MSDLRSRDVVYEFGAFRLEPQHRRLLRADGGRIEIGAKAFDALLYLLEHAGSSVTRQELMQALWPRTIVEDNSLNKAMAAVRRALGEGEYVATLQGRGYQFVADVRISATHDAVRAQDGEARIGAQRRHVMQRRPARAALVIGIAVTAAALGLAFVTRDRGAGWLGTEVRVSQLTTFPGDEQTPALAPDAQRVAFSWDGENGNRDIYVATTRGPGLQRLTTAAQADSDPAWSPDGTKIAFLRRVTPMQRDVIVMPALGGAEQFVHSLHLRYIPDANFAAPKLAWTPDGRGLVFASSGEGGEGMAVYALTLATGELVQLTDGDPAYDSSPALSRDGTWLAFRRDNGIASPVGTLMVQRLGPGFARRGEPMPVPGTTSSVFHSPLWSPDGEHVVFVTGANIREWRRGTEAPRVVHHLPGVLGGFTSSPPELSALALDARNAPPRIGVAAKFGVGTDLWAIPLDPSTRAATGPAKVRFFSSAQEGQPRYSPDGHRVAFTSLRSGRSQIWVAAADESELKQVTEVQADYVAYPNWSPDGERLVFYTFVNGATQIYVVDADGGPPRPVIAGGGPSWSADGEHLYVTEPGDPFTDPFAVTRVRVDDGRRELLVAGHLAIESPDGRRLLYWRGQDHHVHMRSLEGNVADNPEERLVATVVGGIAPVEEGFFYVAVTDEGAPRAFAFYDYAARTTRELAEAPPGTAAVGGLTVAPDGTELLYAAQVSTSGTDLVLLEFAAAAAR